MRASPESIDFLISNLGDPDMVTIDWSELIRRCQANKIHRFADNVAAAVRTFMETDPEFRRYRKQRLAELKNRAHRKITTPTTIALACVAWDCQRAGSVFLDKITNEHLNAMEPGRLKTGDARNHLRKMRKFHKQAGFKISALSTRPAKQIPAASEPIDIFSILYPNFDNRPAML